MIRGGLTKSVWSFIKLPSKIRRKLHQRVNAEYTISCPTDAHNHFVISCLKETLPQNFEATCNYRVLKRSIEKNVLYSLRFLLFARNSLKLLCQLSRFQKYISYRYTVDETYAHLPKIHSYKPNANVI